MGAETRYQPSFFRFRHATPYDEGIAEETTPSFNVPFPELLHADRNRQAETQPTRKALIQAAAEAFSLSGFDGVTIRDIERRAGVNRGLAAHHFGTKEALWEATIDAMMSDMSDELHRYWDFLALVSTPERGRILLRIYVQFIAKHPEFFRLVLLEGRVDSPRSRLLADRCMRPLEDMFRGATGASPDDSVEAQAIQHFTIFGAASVIFGVDAHAKYMFGIDPHDPAFIERYADAIARIWLEFMEAAQPAADAPGDSDLAAA